ncbi:hypothetical protein ABZ319_07105 [Nocardia sp. NPDC005978]|uniref:hypothetical protein n=1 Tax=Nocardia sp. NPDC005978 TaxID=3156725 RepID=UPI0033B7F5D3
MQGLTLEGVVDVAGLPGRPFEVGEFVEFDAVFTEPRDYGVSSVGGWTCIADPQFRVVFDDAAVQALSCSGRVLAWVTNSVSTVHGFAWYIGGVPVRRIVYAEGEVVDEHGQPLPEEASAPEPVDEEFVFEMIARLTGLNFGVISAAPQSVWSCGH